MPSERYFEALQKVWSEEVTFKMSKRQAYSILRLVEQTTASWKRLESDMKEALDIHPVHHEYEDGEEEYDEED